MPREVHLLECHTPGILEVGCDEAGRGPLAGPVVAGAVILPKDCRILYINDSKKLSEKRRNELFDIIILQLKYIYSTTDVLSIIYKVAVKAKTHKYKISMKRLFKSNNKERNIIKYLYYSGIIDVPFYVRLRYTLKTKKRFKK